MKKNSNQHSNSLRWLYPGSPSLLATRYSVRSVDRKSWQDGGLSIALTENGATALPLVADHTTHGDCLEINVSITSTGDGCRGKCVWWEVVPRIEDGLVVGRMRNRRRMRLCGL